MPSYILGIYHQAKTWVDAEAELFRHNMDIPASLACIFRIFHIFLRAKPSLFPSKDPFSSSFNNV